MFGQKNDLLVPALLGLGVFAQNSEVNLANNTTMLLLLFALLTKDNHCKDHDGHHNGYFPDDGVTFIRGARFGRNVARAGRGLVRFDGGCGCGCFDPCDPCGGIERLVDDCCCDPCGHHHRHRQHREHKHEKIEKEFRHINEQLDRIRHCACHHRGNSPEFF